MKLIRRSLVALSLCFSLIDGFLPDFAMAQGRPTGQPNVSVVDLNVQPGPQGGQMVLTPSGYLVPLPGGGVNSNVVQIYMGDNGGYWYVDRTNQTVDLTAYVQQVRTQVAQRQQSLQVAPPQYAPYPYETQNTTVQETSNNSGGSGLGTAAAAGMGAMAGAAMTGVMNRGYYNNVPYGSSMYYGQNGHPYYHDREGKNVFINEDGDVNWNNVGTAKAVKQNNKQKKADQLKTAQQQRQSTQGQSMQGQMHQYNQQPQFNQQQMHQFNQQNSQHFQQQQQWYQQQSRDQSRAQNWQKESKGDNPFVRQGDSGGRVKEAKSSGRGSRGGGGGRASRGGGGGRSRGGGGRGGGRRGR